MYQDVQTQITDSKEVVISELSESVMRYESRYSAMSERCSEAEAGVNMSTEKIRILSEQVGALKAELADVREEQVGLRERAGLLSVELQAAVVESQASRAEIVRVHEVEKASLVACASESSAQSGSALEATREELARLQERYSELEGKLGELRRELEEKEAGLARAGRQLEEREAGLTQALAELDAGQQRAVAVEAELHSRGAAHRERESLLEQQVAELEQKLAVAKENEQREREWLLEQQVAELEQKLAVAKENEQQVEAVKTVKALDEVRAERERLSSAEDQLKELRGAAEVAKAQADQLNAVCEEHDSESAGVVQQLVLLGREVGRLMARNAQLETELSALQKQIQQRSFAEQSVSVEVERAEERMHDLVAKLRSNALAIKEAEQRADVADRQFSATKEQCKVADMMVEELSARLEASQAAEVRERSSSVQHEREIGKLEALIKDLQAQLLELQVPVQTQAVETQTPSMMMATLEAEISKQEANLRSLEAQVASSEQMLSELDISVQSSERKVAAAKELLQSLQATHMAVASANHTELLHARQELQDLNMSFEDAKTQFTDIKRKLEEECSSLYDSQTNAITTTAEVQQALQDRVQGLSIARSVEDAVTWLVQATTWASKSSAPEMSGGSGASSGHGTAIAAIQKLQHLKQELLRLEGRVRSACSTMPVLPPCVDVDPPSHGSQQEAMHAEALRELAACLESVGAHLNAGYASARKKAKSFRAGLDVHASDLALFLQHSQHLPPFINSPPSISAQAYTSTHTLAPMEGSHGSARAGSVSELSLAAEQLLVSFTELWSGTDQTLIQAIKSCRGFSGIYSLDSRAGSEYSRAEQRSSVVDSSGQHRSVEQRHSAVDFIGQHPNVELRSSAVDCNGQHRSVEQRSSAVDLAGQHHSAKQRSTRIGPAGQTLARQLRDDDLRVNELALAALTDGHGRSSEHGGHAEDRCTAGSVTKDRVHSQGRGGHAGDQCPAGSVTREGPANERLPSPWTRQVVSGSDSGLKSGGARAPGTVAAPSAVSSVRSGADAASSSACRGASGAGAASSSACRGASGAGAASSSACRGASGAGSLLVGGGAGSASGMQSLGGASGTSGMRSLGGASGAISVGAPLLMGDARNPRRSTGSVASTKSALDEQMQTVLDLAELLQGSIQRADRFQGGNVSLLKGGHATSLEPSGSQDEGEHEGRAGNSGRARSLNSQTSNSHLQSLNGNPQSSNGHPQPSNKARSCSRASAQDKKVCEPVLMAKKVRAANAGGREKLHTQTKLTSSILYADVSD
eukprot:gene18344-24809_t